MNAEKLSVAVQGKMRNSKLNRYFDFIRFLSKLPVGGGVDLPPNTVDFEKNSPNSFI